MYTVPPSIRRRGLSYAWGLGFIAATLPVMLVMSWRLGGFRSSPAFYACVFGLIPLSLCVWPVAVAGLRRGRQRYHALVIATMALISPVCYVEILYVIDQLEDRRIRHIFRVLVSLRAGTWITLWLEAVSAWLIVLMALIAALRRWCLAPDAEE